MPKLIVGKKRAEFPYLTPLDVALYSLGERALYSSVKFGRARGIMDDSMRYGHNKRVYVEGRGLVDPTCFLLEKDTSVKLEKGATIGSQIAKRFSEHFGAGFQNSFLLRIAWKLAQNLVASSANLPLASTFSSKNFRVSSISTKVLIVGGGLAGLGAALSLNECGVDCVVVDAHNDFGGRTRYATYPFLNGVTYSDFIKETVKNLTIRGVRTLSGVFCGVYEEGAGVILGHDVVYKCSFEKIIFATGSRSVVPLLTGNDLPGVISCDYALTLAHHDALKGKALLYSEDPWADVVEQILARKEGLEITKVHPTEVKAILGKNEVQGVLLNNGKRLRVNHFIYCTKRQPSFELPSQAGVEYSYQRGILMANIFDDGSTRVKNVWIAGSATGLFELESSFYHGRAVGYALAENKEEAKKFLEKLKKRNLVVTQQKAQEEAFVCFCEDIRVSDLFKALKTGFSTPEKAKRFTGWGTGACQGKLCVYNGLFVLCREGKCFPYTQRLPVEPLPFGALIGVDEVE
ncbi:hypothetical protein B9Q02_02655 [Candidatus Marsarchaeota G1 archaeon BE_D]|uniref:SoxA A3 domain-containing protein n=1 Tax=Candidatus Marsarchaeota G1 archaeon BE_D TaxID=1978156 RepID=A0A2R6AIV6_9ARCH|nr:MAG: hypothetical protein B9Q02_02655 [Candidatus Marsarchaeota G1 archaeon BE_D]